MQKSFINTRIFLQNNRQTFNGLHLRIFNNSVKYINKFVYIWKYTQYE